MLKYSFIVARRHCPCLIGRVIQEGRCHPHHHPHHHHTINVVVIVVDVIVVISSPSAICRLLRRLL
jgi:hypothetical protein